MPQPNRMFTTYTGSCPDMFADVEWVKCEEIESTRCCGVVVEVTELREFLVEDEDVMPVVSSSGAFVELDRLLWRMATATRAITSC